jgi:hypothetical protein
MPKAMALWEGLVIADPSLPKSGVANCRTHLLPEFPLRLIGSFADYQTCRRKFRIKDPMIYSESNEFFRVSAKKGLKPTISPTTRNYDQKSMLTFLLLLNRNVRLNYITFVILFAAIAGNCAPSVDFKAPALGDYGPITGHVSGLAAPSGYGVILLDSQNNKIWWDKTHNVHGIPIADDGTFSVPSSADEKGWINNTNVLKAPFIGVWIVHTNFGKFSVEGVPLPEKISRGAVASKIVIRTGPKTIPSVDFEAPPVGANQPIIGQVLRLSHPTDYRVLMLVSAITNVWWDKTHNVDGIPIAENGSFKIEGWVVDPHDLTVPNIGIWIVPTNFPEYSAEGTELPERIPQAAVASKIKTRK